YEETLEVLEELKGEYKLLMLTNGSPDLQHMKLSYSPELVPFFDEIVISGAVGQGKPSETIFKHALDLLDVNTDEAIMIGDNTNNDILSAVRIRMDSIWINHRTRPEVDVTPTYEVDRLKEVIPIIKSYK